MHELPVTESILKVVLSHAEKNNVNKVVKIYLQVGMLSDLEDEWIQHYFDYLSKGTIAEEAKFVIERMPVVLQCNACSEKYEIDKTKIGDYVCPDCGKKDSRLISGKEYYIKNMEVL
jgi:hydrogenase nickel incorporation protein HypA/HybF